MNDVEGSLESRARGGEVGPIGKRGKWTNYDGVALADTCCSSYPLEIAAPGCRRSTSEVSTRDGNVGTDIIGDVEACHIHAADARACAATVRTS